EDDHVWGPACDQRHQPLGRRVLVHPKALAFEGIAQEGTHLRVVVDDHDAGGVYAWACGRLGHAWRHCNGETMGTTRRDRRAFTAGTRNFPGGAGTPPLVRGGGGRRARGPGGGVRDDTLSPGRRAAGGGGGGRGLLEPPLQRPHRHAEDLRGSHLVAANLLEHAPDVLAFERGQGGPEGRAALVQRELGAKIGSRDERRASQHHRPLDHVLELAHVARPRVALHPAARGLVESLDVLAETTRRLAEIVLADQHDVLRALAEGGEADGNNRQAVVEILAEAAVLDHGG